jgi:hypothetical protein
LTIQGQAFAIAASAPELPDEIAFLVRHGVAPDRLRRASAIAESYGVAADRALLSQGLLDEVSFYRALAAELDLPFLPAVTADPKAPFPHGVRAAARRSRQAHARSSRSRRRAPPSPASSPDATP